MDSIVARRADGVYAAAGYHQGGTIVSTVPEQGGRAESGAGREGETAERREGPDVRERAASRGGDATANETTANEATANEATVVRESTIDAAVEMTFPASDPPAWMPPGGPRPADGSGG